MMQTAFKKLSDDNPCLGCVPPDRQPGCHANCEKRAIWLANFKEQKAAAAAESQKFWMLNNYEKARNRSISKKSAYAKKVQGGKK